MTSLAIACIEWRMYALLQSSHACRVLPLVASSLSSAWTFYSQPCSIGCENVSGHLQSGKH